MRFWNHALLLICLSFSTAAWAEGEQCGGIAGKTCGENEFCNYPVDAQCGATDQPGICSVRTEVCTREFMPVCGCDGKTYGNACTASSHGISIAAWGECGSDFATRMTTEGFCIQVVVCGQKDGKWKEYSTPCDAKDDGAGNVVPKTGSSCPGSL